MTEVLIVASAAIVALVIGWMMQLRRPDAPLSPSHTLPDQIDRTEFQRPEAAWLVAVFTSETCSSCARVWQSAQLLAGDEVAVQNVEVGRDSALHERYAITAVPSVVIADGDGVTRRSFIGPPTSTELWSALSDLRSG